MGLGKDVTAWAPEVGVGGAAGGEVGEGGKGVGLGGIGVAVAGPGVARTGGLAARPDPRGRGRVSSAAVQRAPIRIHPSSRSARVRPKVIFQEGMFSDLILSPFAEGSELGGRRIPPAQPLKRTELAQLAFVQEELKGPSPLYPPSSRPPGPKAFPFRACSLLRGDQEARGRTTVNVLPIPGSLSTQIRPPLASTSARAMDRPMLSPTPGINGVVAR